MGRMVCGERAKKGAVGVTSNLPYLYLAQSHVVGSITDMNTTSMSIPDVNLAITNDALPSDS